MTEILFYNLKRALKEGAFEQAKIIADILRKKDKFKERVEKLLEYYSTIKDE